MVVSPKFLDRTPGCLFCVLAGWLTHDSPSHLLAETAGQAALRHRIWGKDFLCCAGIEMRGCWCAGEEGLPALG